MQSKIVIVGLAMIIVAFSTLMLFDNQIRLLIVGVPEQEGLFPPDFPRGGGEFPPLDEEGQIPFQGVPGGRGFRQGGAGGGGAQAFGTIAYVRLSGYLIGIGGVFVVSIGALRVPKPKPNEQGSSPGEGSQGPSNAQPVRSAEDRSEEEVMMSSGKASVGSQTVLVAGSRMQNSGRPVVRLDSVVKTYFGDGIATPAIRGISLEIYEGEFVAIVGPSGSGKSTLLNLVEALDKPTSGKVFIDGVDIAKLNDRQISELRNRKIGFVFQSYNLIPRMTALANVEFPLAARSIPAEQRRQRALEVLQLVGLGEKANRVPAKMSGGEQQRVALARALVTEPAILVGDEPTGNLDTKTTQALIKLLQDLNKKTGKTIIVITHNMEVANATDRIIYLRDGAIEREEYREGSNYQ